MSSAEITRFGHKKPPDLVAKTLKIRQKEKDFESDRWFATVTENGRFDDRQRTYDLYSLARKHLTAGRCRPALGSYLPAVLGH
jgi:hypothetical protein